MKRLNDLTMRYCTGCAAETRLHMMYQSKYCEECFRLQCEKEGKRFRSHNGSRQERKYKRMKSVG